MNQRERAHTPTTQVPEFRCPYCGDEQDKVTTTSHSELPVQPAEGDVSVCWACHGLCLFTGEGGARRKPTDEERAELMRRDDVRAVLASAVTSTNPYEAVRRSRDVS